MYVEAPRNVGQEHVAFVAGGGREQDLAENRANGRLAVVRGDVDDPALDRVEALRRNPVHGAGVIHSEEDGAADGIREGHEFGCEVFRIGGEHAAVAEKNRLELGAAVLSGPELVQNLISSVEHRLMSGCGRLRIESGERGAFRASNPQVYSNRFRCLFFGNRSAW